MNVTSAVAVMGKKQDQCASDRLNWAIIEVVANEEKENCVNDNVRMKHFGWFSVHVPHWLEHLLAKKSHPVIITLNVVTWTNH